MFDGVITGVENVVVFMPQIARLFLFIAVFARTSATWAGGLREAITRFGPVGD